MICKISTSKTPRSCKILKKLSKTLTVCSFLCIGSFLGFSRFSDFLSLQRLGCALCGQHHKKLTRRVLGTPASRMFYTKSKCPISNLWKIQADTNGDKVLHVLFWIKKIKMFKFNQLFRQKTNRQTTKRKQAATFFVFLTKLKTIL